MIGEYQGKRFIIGTAKVIPHKENYSGNHPYNTFNVVAEQEGEHGFTREVWLQVFSCEKKAAKLVSALNEAIA